MEIPVETLVESGFNVNTNKKEHVPLPIDMNNVKNILTNANKRAIVNKINHFKKEEHLEILKIIIKNNDKYSENDNGVFINLSKLKKQTLIDLHTFVEFCVSNTRNLELDDKNRDNMRKFLSADNTKTGELNLENSELLN